MKKNYLIPFMISSLLLLNGCCEKYKDELKKCREGCKEVAPKEGKEFTLSVILEKNSKDDKEKYRYQTLFVESPRYDGIGTTFTIAGTLSYGSFDEINQGVFGC